MHNFGRGFWTIFVIIALLIMVALVIYAFSASSGQPSQGQAGNMQNIQAAFTCDAGKSIDAVFMNATTSTTTGNYVQLSLSDGRQMTLPQVISADGAKYANADQSFVFWNVGNGATIWENGTTTYTNCTTQNS